MNRLLILFNRLRSLFRKRRLDEELDAELRAHLDALTERNSRRGMSPEEARFAARREFGGFEQTKSLYRDQRGLPFLETLVQDLRFGLRMLAKSPGFSAVAILTLALGIGGNTAIFSYIDAWFIKPLPFPHPDRLVIFETQDKKHGWTSGGVTSAADFFDFQKQNTSFEQTVAWTVANFNLTSDGSPELVEGGRVSCNYFDALAAKPILGRTFTAEDDRSGAPHVVILSGGLWQGRYAGDPKVIGRSISIGGEAYTVVGVMPGTFQFPLMGVANLWTPLGLTDNQRADRGTVWIPALGRLNPGVRLKQARAETAPSFAHLKKKFRKPTPNRTCLVSS